MGNTVRILHFADVHLDRPFAGLSADEAAARRRELRDAFRRCLAAARERSVDLVTIGGDLWEDENVTPDTRAFVAHELGTLGIPVLIACGNHDPFLPGGNYERTEWPARVHVFRATEPEEYRLGEISVWGASWGGGALEARFLETFRTQDDRTHLLLLHGTAQPIAFLATDNHCPFDPQAVERAGFALCLAGHIHSATQEGGVIYPGSPEPLSWGETGRHCYAVVECLGNAPTVELVDVNERSYEELCVNCDGATSSAEIEARVAQLLADIAPERLCLKLILSGRSEPDCEVDTRALHERFASAYAALRVEDRTEASFDYASFAELRTADGLFVRTLQRRIEEASDDEEKETLRLALEAGLRALRGQKDLVRVD